MVLVLSTSINRNFALNHLGGLNLIEAFFIYQINLVWSPQNQNIFKFGTKSGFVGQRPLLKIEVWDHVFIEYFKFREFLPEKMLIRILRYGSLTNCVRFIIEVLWPVYYTTKKVNVCDEEKFWPLLKYWGLRIFVWLTEFVLSFLMHE